MKNCCCCNIKSCCTTVLIIISYFWWFKLYLRDIHSDYRVEQIGLIKDPAFKDSADSMFLRKFDTPFKMQNFELIQMVNQTAPHTFSEEGILIISSSQNSVEGSYAHLLQKIQNSNHLADSLGYYIVRKLKNILLNTPKEIKEYTQEIRSVIEYLCKNMMIQKLTIISFEEGSLLTYKAVSLLDYSVYPFLSKIILINAFSPYLNIYHGNSAAFLEDLKYEILRDQQRTRLINQTRIIIIDTVGRNQGDHQINLNFETEGGSVVTFANSFTVSSRFMWNVYCHLQPEEYFKFQPFLWIITKVFNEDRTIYLYPLSIKQIENIILFRELPIKRQMTIQTRAKMLKTCNTFFLEQYRIIFIICLGVFGNIFDDECIRIVRKSQVYFNENTTVLLRSEGKVEVYGDNLEKLAPFDTKGQQSLYLFENVLEYRRIHVINRRKRRIQIQVHGIHRPEEQIYEKFMSNYSISELEALRKRERDYSHSQTVLLCPGFTLLFPMHFYTHYKLASPAYSFNVESLQGECFKGDDYFYGWIYTLVLHWSFGINLIVFSLFCSHISRKQTFSRFYFQLVINSVLTFLHTGSFYLTENILLISVVVLFEQVLNLLVLMSDFMNMPKKYVAKLMWFPLVFELLKFYDQEHFPSPWKVLGLQFLAATNKQNVTILLISFAYIIEYIALDLSNTSHLALICAWLTFSVNQPEQQQKTEIQHPDITVISTGQKKRNSLKKMRKHLVDSLSLCCIAVCLSQDGIVIHYIIDFYIIAHVLFAIHGLFDQYIS